jgi:hypothetical protein
MAPRHYLGVAINLHSILSPVLQLSRRHDASQSLITTIIAVSVLSTLLFASLVLLSFRLWKARLAKRTESHPSVQGQDHVTTAGLTQTDWARKNSNVLWSLYIEEDDLQAQFPLSPKSRLFSIGSVSSLEHGRCPFDRRESRVNPSSQNKPGTGKVSESNAPPAIDLPFRTPFDHQTTPTKNLPRARAMSSPSRHKDHGSFEDNAKRKQSLPVSLPCNE